LCNGALHERQTMIALKMPLSRHVREFTPGDGTQLGMYITAVDRLLIEYALADSTHPISVAEWETQLTRALPQDLEGSLPTIEQIEAELSGDVGGDDAL
jgi:hypothetical protein